MPHGDHQYCLPKPHHPHLLLLHLHHQTGRIVVPTGTCFLCGFYLKSVSIERNLWPLLYSGGIYLINKQFPERITMRSGSGLVVAEQVDKKGRGEEERVMWWRAVLVVALRLRHVLYNDFDRNQLMKSNWLPIDQRMDRQMDWWTHPLIEMRKLNIWLGLIKTGLNFESIANESLKLSSGQHDIKVLKRRIQIKSVISLTFVSSVKNIH